MTIRNRLRNFYGTELIMKTTLSTATPSQIKTECLVVAVLDTADASSNGDKIKPNPQVQIADKAVLDAAADLISSGEVSGKMLETTLLHKPQGLKAKRLLLVGGGKANKFTSAELRKLAGAAVRALKAKDLKSFVFVAPPAWGGEADPSAHSTYVYQRGGMGEAVKAIVEGAFVGNFDPNYYQSDREDKKIEEVVIAASRDDKALQQGIEVGRIIGEAQNFTRDLVNEPGNRMTPTILADRAKKMCDEVGLACEIFDGAKIRELKMGAFWSVAQGSDEDPRMIIMRYEPKGAPEKPVLGLVGKGITFDSGGISIKPADGMEKMKYDMAGGAAMIGAMRAIAQVKPNLRVIGIVCASENMPSGKAQKPGDVQIAMSGKSIEIINTDAEGRLVLADGLHYARQLGATHLIDAATLTGAVVVALGMVNVGVFANDEPFFEQFSRSLQKSGEKMWRLPVDDEYRDMIKSNIADIVNSGGRWGGAVTAAMFLKEFVGDTPWMHLDIAGMAWMEDNKPWIAKGPSGVAVRSLVEFARDFADNPTGDSKSSGTSKDKSIKGSDAAQKRSDSGVGL
jgi:leucyl aminopeptidase